MPRPKQSAIAIQPAQGKKKTFDEDQSDEEEFPVAGPSRVADGDEWEDYSDDEDDDDEAPEAVSVGAALKGIQSRQDEIESTQKSKREAAAARSKAIADAKAAARFSEKSAKSANKPNPAGTKRKVKAGDDRDGQEDADAKRLRKRMEAAMAAGDDESDEEGGEGSDEDMGGEGSDSEDEGDDSEGSGSFHTDSEGDEEEEGEEDEEDAESDTSETLKDGPISDKERSMRAQMQAMMEAAEARSGVVPPKSKKSEGKGSEGKTAKAALKKGTKRPAEEEEEEDNFDLAPLTGYGRPLSAKVLKAAVQEEESQKAREAEAKRIEKAKAREMKQDKRKKRKVDRQESLKQLSNGKHLQLLEPELPTSGSGLPPIMPARSTRPAGAQSRSAFFKTAMKTSGLRPGKGLVDGRKRAVAS